MIIKCEICGIEVIHEKEPYCIRAMIEHLRKEHSMSKYDYTVKYLRGGIAPTCACGCGKLVHLEKGWNKFCKYYSCSHVIYTEERKKLASKLSQDRYDSSKYIFSTYGEENIKNSFNDFKNHNKTLMELEAELSIDKRTLKRAWLRLGLTTNEEFELICEYNKTVRSSKSREEQYKMGDTVYERLYEIIRFHPKQYSIPPLIRFYNCLYENEEIVNCYRVVLKHLVRIYGNVIYDYLVEGSHSKEEIDFFNTLTYFYGKKRVKLGMKLQYGKDKRVSYNYDICIDNFLIIEYDGVGKFHCTEAQLERDKEKEEYARKRGFIMLRAKYEDRKSVKFFNKIDKIISKHAIG